MGITKMAASHAPVIRCTGARLYKDKAEEQGPMCKGFRGSNSWLGEGQWGTRGGKQEEKGEKEKAHVKLHILKQQQGTAC